VKLADNKGNTILHQAALSGDFQATFVIGNIPFLVNKQNNDGDTFLHLAIRSQGYPFIYELLNSDVMATFKPETKNNKNQTIYDVADKRVKKIIKKTFPIFDIDEPVIEPTPKEPKINTEENKEIAKTKQKKLDQQFNKNKNKETKPQPQIIQEPVIQENVEVEEVSNEPKPLSAKEKHELRRQDRMKGIKPTKKQEEMQEEILDDRNQTQEDQTQEDQIQEDQTQEDQIQEQPVDETPVDNREEDETPVDAIIVEEPVEVPDEPIPDEPILDEVPVPEPTPDETPVDDREETEEQKIAQMPDNVPEEILEKTYQIKSLLDNPSTPISVSHHASVRYYQRVLNKDDLEERGSHGQEVYFINGKPFMNSPIELEIKSLIARDIREGVIHGIRREETEQPVCIVVEYPNYTAKYIVAISGDNIIVFTTLSDDMYVDGMISEPRKSSPRVDIRNNYESINDIKDPNEKEMFEKKLIEINKNINNYVVKKAISNALNDLIKFYQNTDPNKEFNSEKEYQLYNLSSYVDHTNGRMDEDKSKICYTVFPTEWRNVLVLSNKIDKLLQSKIENRETKLYRSIRDIKKELNEIQYKVSKFIQQTTAIKKSRLKKVILATLLKKYL
jgi:hypothetical protein